MAIRRKVETTFSSVSSLRKPSTANPRATGGAPGSRRDAPDMPAPAAHHGVGADVAIVFGQDGCWQ